MRFALWFLVLSRRKSGLTARWLDKPQPALYLAPVEGEAIVTNLPCATVHTRLLNSDEPSVRFKFRVGVAGEGLNSRPIQRLRQEIRTSRRVKAVLHGRDRKGRIRCHPYAKWYGAHWILPTLADIGYPEGDKDLIPMREQVYDWLLSDRHWRSIKTIDGRVRRCASQEANCAWSLMKLGLADGRTEELLSRLRKWQWPDGGWNCDRNPGADSSSFMETILPLRALALHARLTGNQEARQVAERAAEVFLKRRLFRRQSDGSVIHGSFTRLHYPCYWHYDILHGLKVIAESGFIKDPPCQDALNRLKARRLPDGGFPAEERYYRVSDRARTGRELVDWGGTSRRHMNEFVTVDAFFVLQAAGRMVC